MSNNMIRDNINEISMTVNKTTTVSETVTVTYKLNGIPLSDELKKKIFFTLNLALVNEGGKVINGKYVPDKYVKKPQYKPVFDEHGKQVMQYRIKGDGSVDHSVKPKPLLKDGFPIGWEKIEKPFYDPSHNSIAYLTGQKHGLFVIDYDDPTLYDEDVKLFPELNNYIEQSRKGYHCYFKSNRYSIDIGTNKLKDKHIDFLYDDCCVFAYPTKYNGTETKLLHHNKLKRLSKELYIYLCKKYNVGKGKVLSRKLSSPKVEPVVNYFNDSVEAVVQKAPRIIEGSDDESPECVSIETKNSVEAVLNAYFNINTSWLIEKIRTNESHLRNSYNIYPVNNLCVVCLEQGDAYPHKSDKESNVFVNRNKVSVSCFGKHSGDKTVISDRSVSRKIRKLLGLVKENKEELSWPNFSWPKEGPASGPATAEKVSNHQLFINYMNANALENNLRKLDKNVYKQHDTIPTYYYKVYTYEEYINKLFIQDVECPLHKKFTLSPSNFDQVLKSMQTMNYNDFAVLIPSKYHFSYLNGVYDINNNVFHPWGTHPDVSTHMLFEKDFKPEWLTMKFNELETPYYDRLTKLHFGDEEYGIFTCLLGRLFFEVRHSNWQVMPFILGCGRTGKTTLIDFIGNFFLNKKTLSETFEGTFGLKTMYQADIIVCPELPRNIKKIFPCSLFKCAVSGDSVNIAKKNQDDETVTWKVPMLWCGNHLPDFDDDGNAATRRLAVFYMNKRPVESIANLHKLLDEERYIILVKLISAYHHYRLNVIKNTIFEDWGKLGIKCFDEKLNAVKSNNNKLFDFLVSSDADHEHNGECIVARKDFEYCTLLPRFQKEYYKYISFKYELTKKSNPWNHNDVSTLQDYGFVVRSGTKCIDCGTVKRSCLQLTGKKCNVNSFRKGMWIEGMKLVDVYGLEAGNEEKS